VSGDPKPARWCRGLRTASTRRCSSATTPVPARATRSSNHTYADRVHDVRLNGKPVGELGLNAGLAGVHRVPVALVSGDSALAAEAKDLLGDGVATVVVKEA